MQPTPGRTANAIVQAGAILTMLTTPAAAQPKEVQNLKGIFCDTLEDLRVYHAARYSGESETMAMNTANKRARVMACAPYMNVNAIQHRDYLDTKGIALNVVEYEFLPERKMRYWGSLERLPQQAMNVDI